MVLFRYGISIRVCPVSAYRDLARSPVGSGPGHHKVVVVPFYSHGLKARENENWVSMNTTGKFEGQGQLRDRLARERTTLAIERTFLAYIRTALAFFVVGIPGIIIFESMMVQVLGGLSLCLGVVVVIFAVYRYSRVKQYLKQPIVPGSSDEDGDGFV